jgi:alpha-beta hydrolase superfamily lysophospholipase
MPVNEQEAAYNRFATPESKLISRDGLTKVASVNFKNLHVPLLITSGTTDTIVPAKLNRANYEKYKISFAKVDYIEFEGRNHFVLGQPTWQEDASHILNWIEKL